jgi:hypothetical protein
VLADVVVAFLCLADSLRSVAQCKRTELPHIRTTVTVIYPLKELCVGIIEWLLVWLIVNALFVVWRFLVTTENPKRSVRGNGIGAPRLTSKRSASATAINRETRAGRR